MSTIRRRRILIIRTSLVVGLLASTSAAAFGLSIGTASVASADPIGECSTTVGEIVAVDFSHFGGPLVRGCAASLSTGYAALYEAGFITTGTEEDGPGFVCRIGLQSVGPSSYEPTPAQDPCVNTPPPTAYWSYWHADAGQNTWTYAEQGAMSYQPPPGSVDAWVFGASNGSTGQPPFPPSAVRATNTFPEATTTTSSVTTSTTVSSTAPPASGETATTTRATPDTAAAKEPSPTAGVSGRRSTSTTLPPGGVSHGGSRQKGDPHRSPPTSAATGTKSLPRIVSIGSVPSKPVAVSDGSPLLFVIGAGVVMVIGTLGVGFVWRRRRHVED